jgi:hypothetical protein
MMCERRVDQGASFYEFSLERHVPADHLLKAIDRFVDLGDASLSTADIVALGKQACLPAALV